MPQTSSIDSHVKSIFFTKQGSQCILYGFLRGLSSSSSLGLCSPRFSKLGDAAGNSSFLILMPCTRTLTHTHTYSHTHTHTQTYTHTRKHTHIHTHTHTR